MKHRDKQMMYTFLMGVSIGVLVGFAGHHFLSTDSVTSTPAAATTQPPALPTPNPIVKDVAVSTNKVAISGTRFNDSTVKLIQRAVDVERSFVSVFCVYFACVGFFFSNMCFCFSYIKSIKSCLGAKCIDEKPKGSNIERVLVTAMPKSKGETLYRMLLKLAKMEKAKIDIEFTSRALPYGYGRNFGFNRVIKVNALCEYINILFNLI
jgi:hypothetical protein